MKAFLFLVVSIMLGVALIRIKFTTSMPRFEDKKLISSELLTTSGMGKVLGQTVNQIEQDIKQKPQKIVEQTVSNVINQVSSDAASLSNNIINAIIGQQLINSYKNLTPEAKIHVQEAVCK